MPWACVDLLCYHLRARGADVYPLAVFSSLVESEIVDTAVLDAVARDRCVDNEVLQPNAFGPARRPTNKQT